MKPIKSLVALAAMAVSASIAHAQDEPLNVLIIWGDDIGYWNVSA